MSEIKKREWRPAAPDLKVVAAPKLIVSSKDFITGFKPPEYLIDGLLQKRFLYSLTAPTDGGKTAILLLIAALTSQGEPVAGHATERGRVIYLAGENPDDIRMRWMAMADKMQFDVEDVPVYFIEGTFSIRNLSTVSPLRPQPLARLLLSSLIQVPRFSKGMTRTTTCRCKNASVAPTDYTSRQAVCGCGLSPDKERKQ